jgi:hypothetical protein
MASKKNQNVIILWHGPPEGDFVSKLFRQCNWCNWSPQAKYKEMQFETVAYNGGGGYPRIYRRDCYDGRLGDGVPYFYNAKHAMWWMWSNPGKPCQVDIRSTKSFGYNPEGLAQLEVA